MPNAAQIQARPAQVSAQARALLIGVNQYEHLADDQHLLGSINDVLSFWKVCRKMGFAPANIVMLTTPVLSVHQLIHAEQELGSELSEYAGKTDTEIEAIVAAWFPENERPKVIRAPAVRKYIEKGLRWLAEGEGADRVRANRLFTFSGHGTTIEHQGKTILALCPSDVRDGEPETYLPTDIVGRHLAEVAETTTIVLDCCFAQSVDYGKPRYAHRVSTLSGATVNSSAMTLGDVKARVFCASGAGESAYQAMLDGKWRGAFSWAFTVALEQWAVVRDGGANKRSSASNIELLFRARMLLETLSFPQHPVLVDTVGNEPFFGKGLAVAAEPDRGDRCRIQMEPGIQDFRWYTFKQDGALIASVLVAKNTGLIEFENMVIRYSAGHEYWKSVASPTVNKSSGATAPLKVEWSDHSYEAVVMGMIPVNYTSTNDFVMNQEVGWSQSSEKVSCFCYEDGRYRWGMSWAMSKDAHGVWSGSQTWYNDSKENVFSELSGNSAELSYVQNLEFANTSGSIVPQ